MKQSLFFLQISYAMKKKPEFDSHWEFNLYSSGREELFERDKDVIKNKQNKLQFWFIDSNGMSVG